MSETLKPCPKCGSTDVVAGFHGDEDGGYGYAECRHAEMSDGHFCGVHVDDEEEAIRIWNTRPTPGDDKPLHPLTLSEIQEQQTDELIKWAFRLGAQSCREMMARFVEGPGTETEAIIYLT